MIIYFFKSKFMSVFFKKNILFFYLLVSSKKNGTTIITKMIKIVTTNFPKVKHE